MCGPSEAEKTLEKIQKQDTREPGADPNVIRQENRGRSELPKGR